METDFAPTQEGLMHKLRRQCHFKCEMVRIWTREGGLTTHVVVGAQLDDDFVVLVAEAQALHGSPIVVPHLAELQLHGHLHKRTS